MEASLGLLCFGDTIIVKMPRQLASLTLIIRMSNQDEIN